MILHTKWRLPLGNVPELNTYSCHLSVRCVNLVIRSVAKFGSSANSSTSKRTVEELNVSKEAEVLATALFLFGNAFGALLWRPISEISPSKLSSASYRASSRVRR